MPEIWAGVDIGKELHHCVVINADGERPLSRRVLNGEAELLELIGGVLAISTDVLWAVDLNHGGAALLIGLFLSHDQPMAYPTGLAVYRASATYKGGEGKTDGKDAFVIADQARMRKDLGLPRPGGEIAVDLRTLTAQSLDVVFDRTRQINRLRTQLKETFRALERSPELVDKGPVMLLTGYQTPAAIRRAGAKRIETWLKNRKVRGAAALAKTAVEAAQAQHTALPGEKPAAAMVARLAKGVMALNEEIAELDALIKARLREHPHAEVIRSLPGMDPRLGAEFIAATGCDMVAFGSADRLAGFAPRPRDSGRVSGNLRRPKRYHRGLLRSMHLSAMVSTTTCPAPKVHYQRKRAEGKGHKQALLALARRRLNVLWAMIRDHDWEVLSRWRGQWRCGVFATTRQPSGDVRFQE
ncbi:IS110 family transposase [Streptomyces sp. NPDC001520]|uniref:IS110 family transposase n=1 Tax=Streptomyces sp. NPDC001520 TaxID=3364581 RepID=UPI0036AA7BE9